LIGAGPISPAPAASASVQLFGVIPVTCANCHVSVYWDQLKALPGRRRCLRQEDRRRPAVQGEDELVQKKIVPKGTYDKIKDQIIAKQK
jgi:hypothetical protein